MPVCQDVYPTVVFDFDVCEEGGVAEVGLATRANVVAVVGLIAPSATSSSWLEGVFKTGGKHQLYQIFMSPRISPVTLQSQPIPLFPQ